MFFIWLSKSCCNNLFFSKSVARSCECRRKDSSVASIALVGFTLAEGSHTYATTQTMEHVGFENEILTIDFACLGSGYIEYEIEYDYIISSSQEKITRST